MGKINILKLGNKRSGEFSLYSHYIKLSVGFKYIPKFKKELLKLLKKYFTIKDLSQNLNRIGRGSISKSTALKNFSIKNRKKNETKI